MANPRRKRVRAIPRAPDGSAFHKCSDCGVLYPIVLEDMHECGFKTGVNKTGVKRFCGKPERLSVCGLEIGDQPRSAFCIYLESLWKDSPDEDFRVIDKKGYEIWKTMSIEERDLYEQEAKRINSAYLRKWIAEIHSTCRYPVDDEVDSAMVGKFNQFLNAQAVDSDSYISLRSHSDLSGTHSTNS